MTNSPNTKICSESELYKPAVKTRSIDDVPMLGSRLSAIKWMIFSAQIAEEVT
jgi:hypothetical protein